MVVLYSGVYMVVHSIYILLLYYYTLLLCSAVQCNSVLQVQFPPGTIQYYSTVQYSIVLYCTVLLQ